MLEARPGRRLIVPLGAAEVVAEPVEQRCNVYVKLQVAIQPPEDVAVTAGRGVSDRLSMGAEGARKLHVIDVGRALIIGPDDVNPADPAERFRVFNGLAGELASSFTDAPNHDPLV